MLTHQSYTSSWRVYWCLHIKATLPLGRSTGAYTSKLHFLLEGLLILTHQSYTSSRRVYWCLHIKARRVYWCLHIKATLPLGGSTGAYTSKLHFLLEAYTSKLHFLSEGLLVLTHQSYTSSWRVYWCLHIKATLPLGGYTGAYTSKLEAYRP